MSALAWTPFAFVMFMVTLPLWKKLWTLSENLPDLPGRLGESNLPEILGKSALPTIAAIGAVAYLGYASGGGGVLAPGFPTLPDEAAGPPNAPNIQSITAAGDSVTFRVSMSDFAGSQDDTHDSTRVLVDSAGKDFTSPLVDSIMGPQEADTVSHGFADGATYDFRALYKGAEGGWSDTSSVFQRTVTFKPGQINDLSATGATDSSLTFGFTTTHNGLGDKANHNWRCKNITSDTASWSWGGTQEFEGQFYDSIGSSVDEAVSREVTGLIAGDEYECGIIAYRGEPEVDAVYGPAPTSPTHTATGTVQSGGGGDPVAPSTPTLSLSATSDTNSVQMTGSGFDGENQTHDSTQWRLDNNSDMSSPFHAVTSATELTSHLATDNTNLTAGSTYYGDVRYFASSTGWTSRSAVDSVVNSAPSEGHPNEPSGFGQLRVWDGSALVPSGWGEVDQGPAKHSKVDTAGLPSGNPALYRHTYPEGMTLDGAGTEFLFTSAGGWFPNGGPATSSERIYISYWLRPDPDFVGHPSGVQKIEYIQVHKDGGGTDHNLFMLLAGQGSGSLNVAIEIQNIFWCSGSSNRFTSSKTAPRGEWTFIEMLLTHNTIGNADGAFKVWVDGVLALDEDGATNGVCHMEFSGSTTHDRFLSTSFDMIHGGRDDGTLAAEQVIDVDDIYISGGSR